MGRSPHSRKNSHSHHSPKSTWRKKQKKKKHGDLLNIEWYAEVTLTIYQIKKWFWEKQEYAPRDHSK